MSERAWSYALKKNVRAEVIESRYGMGGVVREGQQQERGVEQEQEEEACREGSGTQNWITFH